MYAFEKKKTIEIKFEKMEKTNFITHFSVNLT